MGAWRRGLGALTGLHPGEGYAGSGWTDKLGMMHLTAYP